MKVVKKAKKQNMYRTGYIRKTSCVGCFCDSKNCGTCPKILK